MLGVVEAWELVDEREGPAGHLTVVTRRYLLPDGTRGEWDIFGPERTVAIVALTPDDDIVLVRQYRPGPDRILDEIPGGLVDPGETIDAAGRRELLEETGYAGTVTVVAESWLDAAARTRRYVVVVRDAAPVQEPDPGPGEFCEPVLVSLDAFRTHLRSGQLTDTDLGYLALDHAGLL